MARRPAPNQTLVGVRTTRRPVDIDFEDTAYSSFEDEQVLPGMTGLEALGFHVTTLPVSADEDAPQVPEFSEWYQQNMQVLAVNEDQRRAAQQRRQQRTTMSRSLADRLWAAYREEGDLSSLMSEAPSYR